MASVLQMVLDASPPEQARSILHELYGDPFQAAAGRTRQSVRPEGGRQEGALTRLAGGARDAIAGGLFDMVDFPRRYMEAGIDREAATKWAPEMALGMVGAPGVPAGAVGSSASKGIRAYHGSPYDFDRFDMSRIGTGEGHQAYGHGLYFAENPRVAQNYRTDVPKYQWDDAKSVGALLPAQFRGSHDNATRIIEQINDALKSGEIKSPSEYLSVYDVDRSLRAAYEKAAEIVGGKGRMYEVNIRAEPQQFLDWDRPIANQPHVQEALPALGWIKPPGAYDLERTGESVYRAARTNLGDPGRVSDAMREAGIPGIKYLDQGSRALPADATGSISMIQGALRKHPNDPMLLRQLEQAKADLAAAQSQQTSNYVLFRDDIIDILRKYGMAGASPLGALMLGGEQAQSAQ